MQNSGPNYGDFRNQTVKIRDTLIKIRNKVNKNATKLWDEWADHNYPFITERTFQRVFSDNKREHCSIDAIEAAANALGYKLVLKLERIEDDE